jgi:DNA mismatch endonuclease (patch repair protein)
MADVFSRAKRSEIMSEVKSHGNKATELALISILRTYQISGWRRGYKLFGKPDFVFPRLRLAIFVDGCFWHACRRHGSLPTSNAKFWQEKIERNKLRDKLVNRKLKEAGWGVLRVWQHELKKGKEYALIGRILKRLPSSDARTYRVLSRIARS